MSEVPVPLSLGDQPSSVRPITHRRVIIFNKGGQIIKRYKFTFSEENIEITQSYTYLGILFSACGTFNAACDAILSKSLKAFFKLCQLDTRDNVYLTLKLFDSLVTPVCMYGSEIWGPLLCMKLNDSNFMRICDSTTIEKVNIKLCKYILGIGKKNTNAAARGEIGRYPLLINILTHSFKFWMRTCTLPIESLVRKSYLDNMMTELNHNKKSWSSCLFNIMSNFNQTHHWDNQGHFNGSVYSTPFKLLLESNYESQWLSHINGNANPLNPNKLRNYAKFKTSFRIENYVLGCNLKCRRNFTKLRISSHRLAIKTGRYTRPKTPPEKRLCLLCSSKEIEDERHMLLSCSFYTKERATFTGTIETISTLKITDSPEIFNILMTCNQGDIEFSKEICNYVNDCLIKQDLGLKQLK